MEEQSIREMEDEKLVAEAYQRLVDSYLSSRHRKHVVIGNIRQQCFQTVVYGRLHAEPPDDTYGLL